MVTVTIFYVLTNVAYYTMMTPDELLLSDAVAVVSMAHNQLGVEKQTQQIVRLDSGFVLLFFRQTFADRALQGLASIIPILVAMSCLGALNGGFFGVPRYC